MNLNQMLFNHQVAKMKADFLRSDEDRAAALDLVGHHAKQITDWRTAEGLSNLGWPRDERFGMLGQ